MEKFLLALTLILTLPVSALPENTPQQNTAVITPAQLYLDAALTLQHEQQVAEGMLAYAQQYAAGKVLHVISSNSGITLYTFIDGQAQIIREISKAELGIEYYSSVQQILVSPTDKWIMLYVSGRILSIPLTTAYQPLLNNISTQQHPGYGKLELSGNMLVLPGYSELITYSVESDTGYLAELPSLALPTHTNHIAIAGDTLVVGLSRSDTVSPNLSVYRFTDNQWQLSAVHQLGGYDYASVYFLALNPQGTRIAYGNYNNNAILEYSPATNTLTSLHTDTTQLGNSPENIEFIDNTKLLLKRYSTLRSIDTDSLQTLGSFELNSNSNSPKGLSIAETTFSFLSSQGIVILNTVDLTVNKTLQPGEIDVVYPFDNSYALRPLGDGYLLAATHNEQLILYKFDAEGIPQPVQSETSEQLLGFYAPSVNAVELDAEQQLYLLTGSTNYAVVKLNTDNHQLQRVSSGTLTAANQQSVYIEPNKVAVVGNKLIVASYDTLYVFRRDPANKLQFDTALKDGISGTTGIRNVSMLIAHNSNLYSVDNQNSTIAHFSLSNNVLVQKNVYADFSLSTINRYLLKNNLLTLRSSNFLHVFAISEQGALSEHATQFSEYSSNTWVTFGQRFVATSRWSEVQILEQDPASGLWHESIKLTAEVMQQDYNMNSFRLIQGLNNLMMYDNSKRQLNVFSHNSAPYVTDASHLSLQINQGQPTSVDLAQTIRDDEDNALTFTLQGAAAAFALTENGTLSFDGDLASAGDFDVLAEDPALLGSQVRFNYSVNLAPVLKAGSPVINAEQGQSFHFDLASYYTDPEGQAIRYSTSSAASGVTLSESGILAGTFTEAAEFTIVFTATDSAGATAQHSVTAIVAAKPEKSSGGAASWWLALALGLLATGRRLTRRH